MKVLLVDDEARIAQGLRRYFESAGFEFVAAYDGQSGLAMARRERPDLIVLDLMLPGVNGLDVCRILRSETNVPIIMLTARVDESDKLVGLELGADDYVTKPFSPRELVARARAVLRRTQGVVAEQRSEVYRFGAITLDFSRRRCLRDSEEIALTPTEFAVMRFLARHPGQALSRLQILEGADLGATEGLERTIDVHVHNLRQKLEQDPSRPTLIQTVFGLGYRFTDEVTR
jgi:two-component system alkaline phosphatase synthesis response regulator PhoP